MSLGTWGRSLWAALFICVFKYVIAVFFLVKGVFFFRLVVLLSGRQCFSMSLSQVMTKCNHLIALFDYLRPSFALDLFLLHFLFNVLIKMQDLSEVVLLTLSECAVVSAKEGVWASTSPFLVYIALIFWLMSGTFSSANVYLWGIRSGLEEWKLGEWLIIGFYQNSRHLNLLLGELLIDDGTSTLLLKWKLLLW